MVPCLRSVGITLPVQRPRWRCRGDGPRLVRFRCVCVFVPVLSGVPRHDRTSRSGSGFRLNVPRGGFARRIIVMVVVLRWRFLQTRAPAAANATTFQRTRTPITGVPEKTTERFRVLVQVGDERGGEPLLTAETAAVARLQPRDVGSQDVRGAVAPHSHDVAQHVLERELGTTIALDVLDCCAGLGGPKYPPNKQTLTTLELACKRAPHE